MAGRMGNEQVTTQNLTVTPSTPSKGLLLIRGAVPGPRVARSRQDRREVPAREGDADEHRTITTPAGEADGSVELPAEIFDVQASIPLMHQVVVAQLAAARQGTHETKTRGEVSGGGKKPYRQKGTGRARQGSTRAPQFTGGGAVHGPTPRDYAQRTPKKMKAAALRGALSDRARGGSVHVLSRWSTATRRRPGPPTPLWPR